MDAGRRCSARRAVRPGAASSRSSAICQLIRSLADPEDRLVATIVVAANVGTIGLVFTFVPFGTAVGMQFWLLEGMLRGAMADRPRIRIDVLADCRRRSHAPWRDGLGEPRARPSSGLARRDPSRHASRLAGPCRSADSHGAPGMAAVQPPCARQPFVVADRAAPSGGACARRERTRSSTAGTAGLRTPTGFTICMPPTARQP